MKIGDLVRNTRNTKKHWGVGIIYSEFMTQAFFMKDKEKFFMIYWLGVRKAFGMYEGDHHLQAINENR